MDFVTNEKLTIVGAAGMIGSNMAQTALMMRLTPNICLYDPYGPALEGVAEELYHCAFEGANITWTTDIREALTDAAYVVSSGGAARKAGMTREDLLKGNAQIAEQFGKDIKSYCPDVKHVVVVFNPADITGLITLIYAGLKPSQVSTLAALDSTRLRSELAKYFKISPDEIRNCRTYGGHGEQMAVFASTTLVAGRPLSELIGKEMPEGDWADLQQRVIQGGKHIIDLRGRSSFQSPAYISISMIAAAMRPPTSSASVSSSRVAFITASSDRKCSARYLAVVSPTKRIPSPNSTRLKGTSTDPRMLRMMLSADFSPSRGRHASCGACRSYRSATSRTSPFS